MDRIEKYLEMTSFSEDEKRDIRFFVKYLRGQNRTILSSKIYVLMGEPGVGKTHIVKELVKSLDLPVNYVGQEKIFGKNVVWHHSLYELNKKLNTTKPSLTILDDLNYVCDVTDYGEMEMSSKRMLLRIFDKIKSSKNCGLLVTLNLFNMDESMADRTDVIIEVQPPLEKTKKIYLTKKYNKLLTESQRDTLANQSYGFNFRDIDEVVRMSYRFGDGNFTESSIAKALREHVPTSYRGFEIIRDIKINFNDVIGRDEVKNKLREIILSRNNKDSLVELGVKPTNFLMFHGLPGTGKTYMAKALAGELRLPIVNVSAYTLFRNGPFVCLNNIKKFAKRFRNSLIFIDEAEKLLGRDPIEYDGPVQGFLNELFEGVNQMEEVIVIFSMNNLSNFGNSLQDRFQLIEFKTPSEEERKMFFHSKISKYPSVITTDSLDYLSGLTKNMSFRDMEKIWKSFVFDKVSKKELSENTIRERIMSFRQEEDNMIFG